MPVRRGGRRERSALPGKPSSVPQARRFVRSVLAQWDRPELEEAGSLLVSELVGNAVLHARSDIEVDLAEAPEGVVLGVADDSPALPVLRRHSREAGTGRGLWLLHQFASAYGVDTSGAGTGKQVWALLRPEVAGPAQDVDAGLAAWLDQVEGF